MEHKELIAADFHSGTWKRLMQTLQARLQHLRELNDEDSSIERTARIRGQIREVKRLINLRQELGAEEESPE